VKKGVIPMKNLWILGVAAIMTAALSAAAADTKPAPVAKQGAAAKSAAPPSGSAVTGTILETMDSGGYTYMKLKTAGGEVWAAVNQAKVKKGSTATVVNPVEMRNFESKTLQRKFDSILFGALAETPSKGAAAGPSQEEMRAAMVAQHSSAATGPQDVGVIKVTKADGGKTVAEIFAEKGALKEKEVAVRGKVVKFTPEVMGKNWIHLRDGSGSRDKKNDDITVTTKGTATVGDVVLVRGVVKLDKDFGAGYTYPVIIEDAKISK
jgi:hypothetical protein